MLTEVGPTPHTVVPVTGVCVAVDPNLGTALHTSVDRLRQHSNELEKHDGHTAAIHGDRAVLSTLV